MKILITDDIHEQQEMIILDDGDKIMIRRRTRIGARDDWSDWKPPILNRKEALQVNHLISDAILGRVK